MPAERNRPERENFNLQAQLPFQLLEDFEIAMQDVYDLFFDVNSGLLETGNFLFVSSLSCCLICLSQL